MKNKQLVALGMSITIAAISSPAVQAKSIYPAEIMARDLNYPGLGWLGHVGIATASMMDPSGMNQNANLVIEILNEPTVGHYSRMWAMQAGGFLPDYL